MSLHEPPHTSPERNSKSAAMASEQGARSALQRLPTPSDDAITHSKKLIELIKKKISAAKGAIPFDQYMSLALLAPGLGYYSAGSRKFGSAGDFITAPETSILFSHCIARQCQQVLNMYPRGSETCILEIGAGTGRLAGELMLALQAMDSLPQHYWILEPSADLQLQQQQSILAQAPELFNRFRWLTTLPEGQVLGVIIGNEVLDVLPVNCFTISQGDVFERYVTWNERRFDWLQQPARAALNDAVSGLDITFEEGYQSEINLSMQAWIKSMAAVLKSGLLLLIDYGYPRLEYYHPQRSSGSLMCYYRHRAHADPFVYPGLQDITAHVDFTAVAEAAIEADLHVAGYNTQGQFLLCCGIDDLAHSLEDADEAYRMALSQQIKHLTLPSEMGEIFKAIALTREINEPLLGFSMFDLRGKL